MNDDQFGALAHDLSDMHPGDPLPVHTRHALCDALCAIREAPTGPVAVAVDVLVDDDDTRAVEALAVIHDVRRALSTDDAADPHSHAHKTSRLSR